MSLKLVFMGTPDFAVPVLQRLIADKHQIIGVYSQPPRPAGRGMAPRKSPVQQCAESHELPVLTPENFRQISDQTQFSDHGADAAIVVAYGLLLPIEILSAPRHGCFNLHASALPRWRGAAPIQRAIMAGDDMTAACVMQMEEGLDTGPVCLRHDIAIDDTTTAGQLHDQLAISGAELMSRAMADLQAGRLQNTSQSEDGVTYAAKISKAEAHIDFSKPASEVLRHIHGLSPFPGGWCMMPGDKKPLRLKILQAEKSTANGAFGTVIDDHFTIACGEGAIRPLRVQREGKGAVKVDEFLRGTVITPGTRLT